MYCQLEDAYNLTQNASANYDDVVRDDLTIMNNCHPKKVFSAQGELNQYASDTCVSGTPIADLQIAKPVNPIASLPTESHVIPRTRPVARNMMLSVDVRDGVLITFIGVIVIFLLDLMVRIGRRL
jgi:hypothetical protein